MDKSQRSEPIPLFIEPSVDKTTIIGYIGYYAEHKGHDATEIMWSLQNKSRSEVIQYLQLNYPEYTG